MSIQYTDFTPATPPPLQAPRTLSPEILTFISDAVEQATSNTQRVTRKLMEQTLAEFESRLNKLGSPQAQIAAISVNDKLTRLDAPVSKQTAEVLARLITNAELGIDTMLVGPAGCGKSTIVKMLAKVRGVPFHSISWTAGLSEGAALYGRQYADRNEEAAWSKSFSTPAVFLHDELDNADPNAAAKLNAALANGEFYNDVVHAPRTRHPEFVVVATCNTLRGANDVYTSKFQLGGDTLDRFDCVAVTYDADYERAACGSDEVYSLLSDARAMLIKLNSKEILSTRAFIRAGKQFRAGIALDEIINSLTMAWPDSLKKQVFSARSKPKTTQAPMTAPEVTKTALDALKDKLTSDDLPF